MLSYKKVPSFGKSFICNDDKINRDLIRLIKNKNFYTYGQKKTQIFLLRILNKVNFFEFDLKVKLPNKKDLDIKNLKYLYLVSIISEMQLEP